MTGAAWWAGGGAVRADRPAARPPLPGARRATLFCPRCLRGRANGLRLPQRGLAGFGRRRARHDTGGGSMRRLAMCGLMVLAVGLVLAPGAPASTGVRHAALGSRHAAAPAGTTFGRWATPPRSTSPATCSTTAVPACHGAEVWWGSWDPRQLQTIGDTDTPLDRRHRQLRCLRASTSHPFGFPTTTTSRCGIRTRSGDSPAGAVPRSRDLDQRLRRSPPTPCSPPS